LKPQCRKKGLSGHQQCQLYWSQCQQDHVGLYIDFFMTGSSQYMIQYTWHGYSIRDMALNCMRTALLAKYFTGHKKSLFHAVAAAGPCFYYIGLGSHV